METDENNNPFLTNYNSNSDVGDEQAPADPVQLDGSDGTEVRVDGATTQQTLNEVLASFTWERLMQDASSYLVDAPLENYYDYLSNLPELDGDIIETAEKNAQSHQLLTETLEAYWERHFSPDAIARAQRRRYVNIDIKIRDMSEAFKKALTLATLQQLEFTYEKYLKDDEERIKKLDAEMLSPRMDYRTPGDFNQQEIKQEYQLPSPPRVKQEYKLPPPPSPPRGKNPYLPTAYPDEEKLRLQERIASLERRDRQPSDYQETREKVPREFIRAKEALKKTLFANITKYDFESEVLVIDNFKRTATLWNDTAIELADMLAMGHKDVTNEFYGKLGEKTIRLLHKDSVIRKLDPSHISIPDILAWITRTKKLSLDSDNAREDLLSCKQWDSATRNSYRSTTTWKNSLTSTLG